MDTHTPGGLGAEFFMIRVHPDAEHVPPRISGIIERLGTGEKVAFADAHDLIRLLGAWPGQASKMQATEIPGNR